MAAEYSSLNQENSDLLLDCVVNDSERAALSTRLNEQFFSSTANMGETSAAFAAVVAAGLATAYMISRGGETAQVVHTPLLAALPESSSIVAGPTAGALATAALSIVTTLPMIGLMIDVFEKAKLPFTAITQAVMKPIHNRDVNQFLQCEFSGR